MVQFPSDILFDIFSRLPIKSLFRFKCVSPLWSNIIDDPCLAYMHLTRCVQESKILLLDHHHTPDVTFTEAGVFLKANMNLVPKFANSKAYFLEGCCNGLLCFTKGCDDSVLVLFNPLRQEVLALPPSTSSPPLGKRKYGLGFDCLTNKYKIVSVFFREGGYENPDYNLGAEVYTLGTSSWRTISKGPPFPLIGKPIFACGALHWLVNSHDALKDKIVSFDVGKEEFGLISLPKIWVGHLFDLGANLAMVDLSSDTHIEIWVMKEYEKKEWIKEYKIDINAPMGMPNNSLIEVIGLWELGEILLKYYESLFSYNPRTGELRYIQIPGLSNNTEVLCHIGNLLSISRFQSRVKV